jgi:hypothetical protein
MFGFVLMYLTFILMFLSYIYCGKFILKRIKYNKNKVLYSDFFLVLGLTSEIIFSVLQLSSIQDFSIVIEARTRILAVMSWIISTALMMTYFIRICPALDPRKIKIFTFSTLFLLVIALNLFVLELNYLHLQNFISGDYLNILSFFNVDGVPVSYSLLIFTLISYLVSTSLVNKSLIDRRKSISFYIKTLIYFMARLGLRFNCFTLVKDYNYFLCRIFQFIFGLSYVLVTILMYYNLAEYLKKENSRC